MAKAEPKEKKSRSVGQNLFLKGERSYSQKSAFMRRPYRPGIHGQKRRGTSEFGIQLKEKQKLKWTYGLREKQFRKYIDNAMKKTGAIIEELVAQLELRLDNAIFRAGFAPSRSAARQLVNHAYFLVNNKLVNIPSFQLKPKDKISVKPHKKEKAPIKGLKDKLKKHKLPSWLKITDDIVVQVDDKPSIQEVHLPFDIGKIIEFYTK